MTAHIQINQRKIGNGHPAYIIAEISCNHEGDKDEAKQIIKASAEAGADAVKIQTYTADTISRNFDNKAEGTIWDEIDLHGLYEKAETPWEWTFELKEYAQKFGLDLFSSPFDETAVDFLVNEVKVPALKIASFEIVDTKLLEKAAKSGLPIIMSNGMTDFLEMDEAIRTLQNHGCEDLAVLHCNSGYPAAFEEANLKTMQAIADLYNLPVGVSDHTLFARHETFEEPMAHVTPVEAVKLGASIVEIHVTLDRQKARALFDKNEGGYDWPFSMEPAELKKMIDQIRHFEAKGEVSYDNEREEEMALKTHGHVNFAPTEKELASRNIRPSLWVVRDIKKGEPLIFAAENKEVGNFDSIRPGGGLHIRFADFLEGQKATQDIQAGTPLEWHHLT